MENKKKKNTTKKTTKKTVSAAKKTTTKKVTPKKNTTPKKVENKNTVKKVAAKKVEPKKEVPKKIEEKAISKEVEVKKIEPKKVETKITKKEEVLEKTYIFNKDEQKNLSEIVKEIENKEVPSYESIGRLDKENKRIILGLTISIALIIIGCLIYVVTNINKPSALEEEYIEDNKHRNVEVDDKKVDTSSFKDADYSNIINTNIDDFEVRVAEGKDMLVIISSDTCYYCVTFEPTLNEVLVAKKAKAIRLNITKMTTKETDRLRNYYAFKAAPTLLNIKNGEVITDYEGAMDKEALETWYDTNVN